MSDAYKCFSYLHENSPKWLSELTSLERHIEEKQKEMARMPSERPALPVRNGSIASIREFDVNTRVDTSTSSPPADSAQQSSTRRPNVLTKRKKNPGSIASTSVSGAHKFRSRTMIIVYYDSEIQRAFEMLVREISIGRNLVRKGKMAEKMEALTEGLNETVSGLADGDVLPALDIPSFRRSDKQPAANGETCSRAAGVLTAFQRVDKALEKAQNLCERAAHQFLRDGDCRLETESAKEAFQEVLNVSNEELPRLQALEKEPKRQSAQKEQRFQNGETSPPPGFDFGTIEVDDEEEQMPVTLPTLRLTSRMGPRQGLG